MKLQELLTQLFPNGCDVATNGWLVTGEATSGGKPVSVLGTTDHVLIGVRETMVLADKLLEIVEQHPGRPIVLLVDNDGQRLALVEELLALPEYFAHLLRVQRLAYLSGSKLVAILYGNAVAGGFIAFGMLADRLVSISGAEPSVMKLEAILRVTKMPLEKLTSLATTVPVFAPGSDNFFKMGGLYEIWTDHFADHLHRLIQSDLSKDLRAGLGQERGGRTASKAIIDEIIAA